MKRFEWVLLSLVSSLSMLLPATVAAHGIHRPSISSAYNNKIIDDSIFTRHSLFSPSAIQAFLDSKVSDCQDGYTCLKDYSQGGKSAARIIYEAARDYDMNPQVILVTLQKEQSLVTDDFPVNAQYRTAMGYGCPESESVCNSDYYGFTNQVRLGTKLLRVGLDRDCGNEDSYPGWDVNSRWRVGNTTNVDGKATTLKSCATGSLYNYTPHRPDSAYKTATDGNHYYGNYNFIYFFSHWFGSLYSSVRLIECSGNQYLVESYIERKRQITAAGLDAWGLENAYFEPGSSRCGYDTYAVDLGRLVKSRDSGSKYFVDLQTAHHIQSQAVATAWGLGNLETTPYPLLNGSSIKTLNVEGTLPRLARSASSNKVYWLSNGEAFYVLNSETSGSPSLALVRGYNSIGMATFSADVLSPIKSDETIDYSFRVGSAHYVFDHGLVRRLSATYYTDRWAHIDSLTLNQPNLNADILNVLESGAVLKKGFRRSDRYYLVRLGEQTPQVTSTTSKSQATTWGVADAPIVTSLLSQKLLE